jgi:hypothetical protein
LTLYVWLGLWGIARSLRRGSARPAALPLAALLSFVALGMLIVPLWDPRRESLSTR